MSFCKDCIKGVTHEGTPKGKWETIGGISCYVTTPSVDYPKDKVVLYISDLFGAQFINAQLLADDFAQNGFKTIIPDYFDGDPVPADALNPGSDFDLMGWLKNHGVEKSRGPLEVVVSELKSQGITIGATGYCYGGRFVFDFAFKNDISVAVCSHPSFLKAPDDLEKYKDTSKAPLLLNTCTIDEQFPHSAQEMADKILASFEPGYRKEYWEGCQHGFAVRGDMSDPKVKAGKEGAFKAAVEWFQTNL
ncbi:dienelactone hydrolase [Cyathus striatus]|nr:dienelactone hydrolase [Cyathus striatus]